MAGEFGGGVAGPINVTLNDLTLNNVLTLDAVDVGDDGDPLNDYRFIVSDSLTAKGGLEIVGGEVEAQGALTLGTLHIDGGRLVRTGVGADQNVVVTDSLELITD